MRRDGRKFGVSDKRERKRTGDDRSVPAICKECQAIYRHKHRQ